MSEANLETVRRYLAAFNERDLDAVMACCAEEVQLITPVSELEGAYRGRGGVERFFADAEEHSTSFRLEIERLEAVAADRVIAFLRTISRGRSSGIPSDLQTATVYDLAGGRIRRIRVFLDRREALDVAGRSG